MGFQDIQEHCKHCRRGKSCDGYHVYVMELDQRVSREEWFEDANPNYTGIMTCVYVGMSWHPPTCRRSMHIHCKFGAWRGHYYTCYCKGAPKEKKCKGGNQGSSKVKPYNLYLLRPDLYRDRNSQDNRSDSGEEEELLADDLRELGYGVWAGHLDA